MPMPFLDPATGRPLAEWWRRLLAYLLDGLIVGVPVGILSQFALIGSLANLNIPQACTKPNPPSNCGTLILHHVVWPLLGSLLGISALALVIGAGYFTLMVGSRRGQTVGMMALSIAVRDERVDQPISKGRAFVRWLVVFALGLLAIPQLIDFLSPLWDRRRQAWHDHAAGSVVVDLRYAPPPI